MLPPHLRQIFPSLPEEQHHLQAASEDGQLAATEGAQWAAKEGGQPVAIKGSEQTG